jgi:hypothetical protein
VAVPVIGVAVGAPGALLAMFSVAFLAPSAPLARKRTVIVRVAPTARVVFVPVNVKLFAFGPVIVRAPMATGSSPLLVTVIVRVPRRRRAAASCCRRRPATG